MSFSSSISSTAFLGRHAVGVDQSVGSLPDRREIQASAAMQPFPRETSESTRPLPWSAPTPRRAGPVLEKSSEVLLLQKGRARTDKRAGQHPRR